MHFHLFTTVKGIHYNNSIFSSHFYWSLQLTVIVLLNQLSIYAFVIFKKQESTYIPRILLGRDPKDNRNENVL